VLTALGVLPIMLIGALAPFAAADLDFSEFEASFDSITLALASHLGALAPYRER